MRSQASRHRAPSPLVGLLGLLGYLAVAAMAVVFMWVAFALLLAGAA